MPQSFLIGSLRINIYGILVGLGVFFSYWYSSKKKGCFSLTQKQIDITYLFGCFFALVGARFYHVLSSLDYYLAKPSEIFSIQNGGLGIFGVILGAIFGIWLSARIQKISLKNTLNLTFPSLLISQAIGRIGNFFNQEGLGPNRFPTFFLESFFCFFAFIVFYFLSKKRQIQGFPFYLISYGLIRFLTEFLRYDTWKINNIQVAHVISLIMISAGVILIRKKYFQYD